MTSQAVILIPICNERRPKFKIEVHDFFVLPFLTGKQLVMGISESAWDRPLTFVPLKADSSKAARKQRY